MIHDQLIGRLDMLEWAYREITGRHLLDVRPVGPNATGVYRFSDDQIIKDPHTAVEYAKLACTEALAEQRRLSTNH